MPNFGDAVNEGSIEPRRNDPVPENRRWLTEERWLNGDDQEFSRSRCFELRPKSRLGNVADIGEIAVLLVEIEAVADHEDIGNLKAHVIRLHGDDTAGVLIQQGSEP